MTSASDACIGARERFRRLGYTAPAGTAGRFYFDSLKSWRLVESYGGISRVRDMAAREMSRDELLEFVRQLPEKTPIPRALTGHSSKQAWIYWLSNYADLSDHPLRAQRDAGFIYNHWWNAPIFIWLAEASGVDGERVQRAAKIIASASGNSTTQAAAIRRILPWHLVAKHLRERKRIEPTVSPESQSGI